MINSNECAVSLHDGLPRVLNIKDKLRLLCIHCVFESFWITHELVEVVHESLKQMHCSSRTIFS
ncbi:hypothetical protein HK407_08g12780 [Ordospora pajunii]|uniref:uncharacterized protein n=1 Tax=Ordospora pajunii TaxID=3039483 RepID=UPI0029528F59|nr:uncharacterized protein HK407_08g12780 [Ordospora pajunii]KAH9411133.1 hypothetical protein HK407_08g12780 [Ordospora pajunii]